MEEQYIKINNVGDKFYYSDKAMTVLHREDGPAIEWTSGSKAWYINGKLHREDGPANEWTVGGNEWWVDGKRLTEEEFNLQMSPIELTLDEIAEKFGVSVDKLKIKA